MAKLSEAEKARWFDEIVSRVLVSRGDLETVRSILAERLGLERTIDRVGERLGCSVGHAVVAIALAEEDAG